MNEAGEIVGMVDVLKLTYATLEQVCVSFTFTIFMVANLILLDQHDLHER